nr:hypothetical protein [Microtetraspora sp. NBRC 16547]
MPLSLPTPDDKTVRLWDVTTHRPTGTPLTGHTDYVNALALSPDGHALATASNDQTVRLWSTPPSADRDLFSSACRVAGRSLTPQEWRDYGLPEPFQTVCAPVLTR